MSVAASPSSTSTTAIVPTQQYVSPSNTTLQHCVKISVVDDKPIMLDYWTNSLDDKVLIGVRENGEKLLVKSEDEYTSPIEKIFKVETEYIIVTENSLYIVSASIKTKRIS
jgi:hypothetical protein